MEIWAQVYMDDRNKRVRARGIPHEERESTPHQPRRVVTFPPKKRERIGKCKCREMMGFQRWEVEIRFLNSGPTERGEYVGIGEMKRRI